MTGSQITRPRRGRGTEVANYLGLVVTCGLLIVQPFHADLTHAFPFYRESFALAYLLLLVPTIRHKSIRRNSAFRPGGEIFWLLMFGALLFFYALLDPSENLYGATLTDASQRLASVPPRLYVIRNALLYMPMVIYLAARGLRQNHITMFALICSFVAPLSVAIYLLLHAPTTVSTIAELAALGGAGLSYNSYVPYLTFPILAALYLALSLDNLFARWLSVLNAGVLIVFVTVSTSRQSVLFVLVACWVYWLSAPPEHKPRLVIGILAIGGVSGLAFMLIQADYASVQALSQRFGYLSPIRAQLASKGLALLTAEDYLSGAGLSSVIVSGPHNDYVRWLQRIGLPGMFFAFLHFMVALRDAVRQWYERRPDYLLAFLVLAIGFTVFHSLFGHPREDAFQALYAFLGLGLWLGYRTSMRPTTGQRQNQRPLINSYRR